MSLDSAVDRYMELVHTDSNFKPEESFFQLFSDPLSTRLTRVQLKEDFVCDRDLEAIRKQVRFHCLPTLSVYLHERQRGDRNISMLTRNTVVSFLKLHHNN